MLKHCGKHFPACYIRRFHINLQHNKKQANRFTYVITGLLLFWVIAFSKTYAFENETDNPGSQPTMLQNIIGNHSINQDTPPENAMVFSVPLNFNESYLGDMSIHYVSDTQIYIESATLLRLVQGVISENLYQRLSANIEQKSLFQISQTGLEDFTITFDPALVELAATTSSGNQAMRSLSLRARDSGAPEITLEPQPFSAYFNVVSNASSVSGIESNGPEADLFFDGAAHLYGVALEFEAEKISGQAFRRQSTRFVYDLPKQELRLTAGDLVPALRGFQSSIDLAGVAILRSREQLNPFAATQSFGRSQFTLERNATVDVLINGIRKQTLRLDRGNYDLRDFPLELGSNNVELLILDDSGREDRINFITFFDPLQLEPGEKEYFVGLGIRTELVAGRRTYLPDEPQMTGYYRQNMSDRMTVGVNAQVNSERQQIGTTLNWFPPVPGRIDLDTAVELDANETDLAASLRYVFQTTRAQGGNQSFQVGADYVRGDLGADGPGTTDTTMQLTGRYSTSLTDALSASFGGTYTTTTANSQDSYSASLDFSYRPTQRLNTNISTVFQEAASGETSYGALFQLSYRLGERHSSRASYDTLTSEAQINLSRFASQRVHSVNYSFDAQRNEFGDIQLAGNAGYIGNRFELDGSYTDAITNATDDTETRRAELRLGTSFSYTGGMVAVGRPIRNSFALFSAHESLQDADIIINSSEDGYDARSGLFGAAVYPMRSSAHGSEFITYELPDAPVGYDTGPGGYTISSPYRGGYAVEVGSDASVSVIGRLVDILDEPVAFSVGRVSSPTDTDYEGAEFFTNRNGRFALSGLRPGQSYLVTLTSRSGSFEVVIPEGSDLLIRLDTLKLDET